MARELLHVSQAAAALNDLAGGLGDVIYWGASLLAGTLIFGAGFAALFGTGEDRLLMDVAIAAVALVVWLVGGACRYVLAGRRAAFRGSLGSLIVA